MGGVGNRVLLLFTSFFLLLLLLLLLLLSPVSPVVIASARLTPRPHARIPAVSHRPTAWWAGKHAKPKYTKGRMDAAMRVATPDASARRNRAQVGSSRLQFPAW